MTYTVPQKYVMYAHNQRSNMDYERAGTYYTAASHGWLMRYRSLPEVDNVTQPDNVPENLGRAIQDRLAGAVCFRLAEQSDRAKSICQQGIAVVEDADEYDEFPAEGSGANPRKGLFHEMIGDLRLVGNMGDYDAAYLTAAEYYNEAESPRGWQAEPEFDSLIQLLIDLAAASGRTIDDAKRRQIQHASLRERVQYKRAEYPNIVSDLISSGEWVE